jgi:hypothetical protein
MLFSFFVDSVENEGKKGATTDISTITSYQN